ncbi:MAG: pilus assembly protein TadG-related protein [Acidimicrobiia bacterium]|nr:pilus assembly protein TadG-related protein [Acidimicrobiia bacterium]
MRTLLRLRHVRADQRGASAAIVALLLTALLGAAALAIDVGHWYDRANQLHVAADAAALSGVAVRTNGGDQAAVEAEVTKLLADNGIDAADPRYEITTTFVDVDQVRVEIVDRDVDVIFGGIFGDRIDITRGSTAQLDVCKADCRRTVALPQPFVRLDGTGTGDGFTPLLVPGSRYFAINHKVRPLNASMQANKQLTCIDRTTNRLCAGYPKALSTVVGHDGNSAGDIFTNNRPTAIVIGARIYYQAQTASTFGLGCFDTATDTSCGFVGLANLAVSNRGTFYSRGGGPALAGGKLYLISHDLRWHCVEPSTMTQCASYPAPSGLADDGLPTVATSVALNEVEIAGNRAYSVMHYGSQDSLGSVLTCLDLATDRTCSGFGESGHRTTLARTATGSTGGDGAIFVRYDSSAAPSGICMLRGSSQGMDCVDLNGRNHGVVSGLDPLLNPTSGSTMDMYAELHVDGRSYFPEGWVRHATLCWDWRTQRSCGRAVWPTVPGGPGTNTGDYGYAISGRCIVGLGHQNVWWAFDRELNPCNDTSVTIRVPKCVCSDGREKWGVLSITRVDLQQGVVFNSLVVTVRLTDGTVLHTQDLVGTDGTIDLSTLPIPAGVTELDIEVDGDVVAGVNPWAGADDPLVEFGVRAAPNLVR